MKTSHAHSFWMIFLEPLMSPVLLAAIRPHFLPLETSLLTVVGWPTCWWLPPPCGCSTGFIATPLTLGQCFLFPFILNQELAALRSGLSVLWPPAQIPTMALQPPMMVFLVPDGSLTLVFLPSSEWPMMTDEVPEALAKNLSLQPYLHNCSWWYLLAFGSLGWYFRRKEMLCFRHRWIGRCTFLRQRWNTQFFACICMYLWRQPLQVVLLDLGHDRCPSQYPSHNLVSRNSPEFWIWLAQLCEYCAM